MAKYHINPETGNPGLCKADPSNPNSRGCRFGESEDSHYPSKAAAAQAYEEKMEAIEARNAARDPQGLTDSLEQRLIRPQSVEFDIIAREIGWIREWEKPWTNEEAENLETVEKIAAILEREPFTEADEQEARRLLRELHPTVVRQNRTGSWSTSDPDADNWRARDKMIHELGDDLIRRRLGDELSHEPAEAVENSGLLGLQEAQDRALKGYNRPVYGWTKPEDGPEIGEVEPHFQEAIGRVVRGDSAAPESIIESSDHRSLVSEQERIFNMLHPDSPIQNNQLYLASVFPVRELKGEMERVGLDGVSVSSLENGREWGNVYTVMTPEGGTRSFAVYEHRNTDSIIINGKEDWDGDGLPYAGESKNQFYAEFAPDDRKRAAQALTFYMMQAQSGALEEDTELVAKAQHRDWNAILDAQLPGFKSWRQSQITDRYIAPEQESEEDILSRLDFPSSAR